MEAADQEDVRREEWRDVFPLTPLAGHLLWRSKKRETGSTEKNGCIWCRVIFKYWFPMFCVGCCLFLSMVMLHVGTYFYVHEMAEVSSAYQRVPHIDRKDFAVHLSFGLSKNGPLLNKDGTPHALSYGSLHDPLEEQVGYEPVGLATLDKIAMLFPAMFVVFAILMDELGAWTRVMLCNCFLAVGKGLFGMMTVVNDSAGWAICQQRLGEEGVQWMREEHVPMGLDFFKMELFGVNGHRLRWCADMMWSGHTYFTTLYALGLFELIVLFSKEWSRPRRNLALFTISMALICQQSLEVYLVLLNRFHYTMDVVMAFLITILFYTNGAIAEVAKRWVWAGCRRTTFKWDDPVCIKMKEQRTKLVSENGPKDLVILQLKELYSNSEILMPNPLAAIFCCGFLPCCPWFHRHHGFDDQDIADFLFTIPDEERRQAADHMGVSYRHYVKDHLHHAERRSVPRSNEGIYNRLSCL